MGVNAQSGRRVQTTTPGKITRHIERLVAQVAPGGRATYLTVRPEPDAVVNECFPNVEAKVARDGGQMVYGWQLWEWPHVLVEAEFHAVWRSPGGDLVEVTPKAQGEEKILFVPNARREYTGDCVDNVRMALRDDQVIRHFIRASELMIKVMNSGERCRGSGTVRLRPDVVEPVIRMQGFLGTALSAGLRDHNPCLCGSGSKYKQCHGREFAYILETD